MNEHGVRVKVSWWRFFAELKGPESHFVVRFGGEIFLSLYLNIKYSSLSLSLLKKKEKEKEKEKIRSYPIRYCQQQLWIRLSFLKF
ncbi:hypothetical protein Peur_033110 [Populus x canadensis]